MTVARTPDERWMRRALREAQRAYEVGEVPVGAVVVCGGAMLAAAHNQVETLRDPSAHAEMLAVREACRKRGDWRLPDCVLYVTLEPCIQCAGLAVLARLGEIVYATEDRRMGGLVSLMNAVQHPLLPHRVRFRRGPLGNEARDLLQRFFRERRS